MARRPPRSKQQLEHRLVGVRRRDRGVLGRPLRGARPRGDRFAPRSRAAADRRRAEPGLYLRAALAELEMRPPVPAEVRDEVERDLAERGAEALHAELPEELRSGVHPNDRKRIARLTELTRLGIAPHASSEGLWTEELRRPTASGRDHARPRRASRPHRRPGRRHGRGRRRRRGDARGCRPEPLARRAPRSASRSCCAAMWRR